jgi:hypothetical protein
MNRGLWHFLNFRLLIDIRRDLHGLFSDGAFDGGAGGVPGRVK